jgi:uncharacterized protein
MAGSGDFAERYGPWVLVAGGSEGLGAAFADECAARGLNLLLVGRRRQLVEETAARLRAAHGVQVRAITADLADPGTVAVIEKESTELEIGLLILNAAVAGTGWFLRTPLAEYYRMLDVNCRAAVGLLHMLGTRMAARGRGGIIVMSSLAAFQGSPLVSVYGATKSFLVSVAEAVGDELKDRGVDVTVCCPAVVRTPQFLSDGHNPKGPQPLSMEPAVVARAALGGLGRKRIVVPGAMSRLVYILTTRILPRAAAVRMIGRNTRAMYGTNPS